EPYKQLYYNILIYRTPLNKQLMDSCRSICHPVFLTVFYGQGIRSADLNAKVMLAVDTAKTDKMINLRYRVIILII
ncbi:hypothetical protein, partial [uncultured Bacteroides sp.]|uniref:hypothetical protein n=1 Tax=uncultured Bacteroides sp. TaxID=162156 RepID=UPI002675E93A